jgi:hypothetical protein
MEGKILVGRREAKVRVEFLYRYDEETRSTEICEVYSK